MNMHRLAGPMSLALTLSVVACGDDTPDPVDMGMPPVDMGMPPVDMGMPPVDMGMMTPDMGMMMPDMGMMMPDMGMMMPDMGMMTPDMGMATLASIAVNPGMPSIAVGMTQQLTAIGTFSDNSTSPLTVGVTWASSDPTIATVDTNGLVTAVAAGSAMISATVGGVSGVSNITVTAVAANERIVFDNGFGSGVSFAPFGGSANDLQLDTMVTRTGTASLRIPVPAAGYTGGALAIGAGEDLSRFNALTFWIRASGMHTLNVAGIGDDAMTNTYRVERGGIMIDTTWQQVIIPIPDSAQFNSVTGLFHFAEGSEEGAYNIWIDDVKYESLPAAMIGMGTPAIATSALSVDVGATGQVVGQSIAYMIGGTPLVFGLTPSWLSYVSSNTAVATVDGAGVVTGVGSGMADITATLGATAANGVTSVVVAAANAPGAPAPTPMNPAANVISLYSDAYTNQTVDTFRTPWSAGSVMESEVQVMGNSTRRYTGLGFVGIEFVGANSVNATMMTHFHMDVWTANATEFRVKLVDFGANNAFGGGDDVEHELVFDAASSPALQQGRWVSLDLPFTAFTGLTTRGNLSQIVLVGNNNGTVFVDNIYFRR